MSDNEMETNENHESDDSESDDEENEEMESEQQPKEVYLPGKPLEPGFKLDFSPDAYIMYHKARTSDPCLSFDIIPDSLGNGNAKILVQEYTVYFLGDNRETFPMTAYIVAGTQAPQNHFNNVIVMKLSNLCKTQQNENSDDDDDDTDEEENNSQDPKMIGASIKHQGCVNRIRSTVIDGKVLAATWSEMGRVNIFNLMPQLQAVDSEQLLAQYNKDNKQHSTTPIFTFNGHKKEGFGLDWSDVMPGVLATGDCRKDIHIWNPSEGATWLVDQRPLIGHDDSVEDLQWSPNERNVLASCSCDKTIRIWDTRANPNKACMITCDNAHQSDINVISWNRNEPFIVSGGDDGFLHIWDLRTIQSKKPLATFKHHTDTITTVEWHPNDSSVFASGGSDDQISLWDLSVEKDDEESHNEEIDGVPPQLLFIHQGQTNIKELHWHRQLPGVIISTAESDFNVFKTIST